MTNNIANEMREIANTYHENRETKLQEEAKEIVNSILLPSIRANAEEGKFSYNIYLAPAHRARVAEELRALGFTVEKGVNNTIDIAW